MSCLPRPLILCVALALCGSCSNGAGVDDDATDDDALDDDATDDDATDDDALDDDTDDDGPAVWSCMPHYYGSYDGCDCGCGIPDPDCGDGGCVEPRCHVPGCQICHDATGASVSCYGGDDDTGDDDITVVGDGDCTEADVDLLSASDPVSVIAACLPSCLLPMDRVTCGQVCVVEHTGVSEPCALCFGFAADCVLSHCALDCVDPYAEACIACALASCAPAFQDCSGIMF